MFLYLLGLVAVWFVYRWFKESKRVDNKGDKYVYITGCDSGFGNTLAKYLDKLGFRVIAGCYTEKGEDELKKSCSDRLTAVSLDVTNSESVSRVAASIKSLVGQNGEWSKKYYRAGSLCFSGSEPVQGGSSLGLLRISVLVLSSPGLWAVVNNAGVATPTGPTDWLNIEDYKSMLAVNLNGVIDVTLSVIPLIKKAKGRVVNVASVFGRISPVGGAYCVSKYGVEAFNDSLR